MKYSFILLFSLFFSFSYSQVSGVMLAKEYSKEQALYNAKFFVMNEVVGIKPTITKFKIDPLAAASSGELTTLIYSCEQKDMRGLVFGFYGDYWNKPGVIYKAYAFKNFNEKQAHEVLSKLDSIIEIESKYLNSDQNTNNIYFSYEDVTFLIYVNLGLKVRVFWKEFDSEWEYSAFRKTKKRFEKKINE